MARDGADDDSGKEVTSRQVFVPTLTGGKIVITLAPSDAMDDLKEKIEDKEGVPPDQQLIRLPRGIEDVSSLSCSSTVQLRLPICGHGRTKSGRKRSSSPAENPMLTAALRRQASASASDGPAVCGLCSADGSSSPPPCPFLGATTKKKRRKRPPTAPGDHDVIAIDDDDHVAAVPPPPSNPFPITAATTKKRRKRPTTTGGDDDIIVIDDDGVGTAKSAGDDVIVIDDDDTSAAKSRALDDTLADLRAIKSNPAGPYLARILEYLRDNPGSKFAPFLFLMLCPVPKYRSGASLGGGGENLEGNMGVVSVRNFHHLLDALPPCVANAVPESTMGPARGAVANVRRDCPVEKPKDEKERPGCPKCSKEEAKVVAAIANHYIEGCESLGIHTLVANLAGSSVGMNEIFKLIRASPNAVIVSKGTHISNLSTYRPGFGSQEQACVNVTRYIQGLSRGVDEVLRRAGEPALEPSVLESLCDISELVFVCRGEDIPHAVATFREHQAEVLENWRRNCPEEYAAFRERQSNRMTKRFADSGTTTNQKTGNTVTNHWDGTIGKWRQDHPEEYAAAQKKISRARLAAQHGITFTGKTLSIKTTKKYRHPVTGEYDYCQRSVDEGVWGDGDRVGKKELMCTERCNITHGTWKLAAEAEEKIQKNEAAQWYRCPECSAVKQRRGLGSSMRCLAKSKGGCSNSIAFVSWTPCKPAVYCPKTSSWKEVA